MLKLLEILKAFSIKYLNLTKPVSVALFVMLFLNTGKILDCIDFFIFLFKFIYLKGTERELFNLLVT